LRFLLFWQQPTFATNSHSAAEIAKSDKKMLIRFGFLTDEGHVMNVSYLLWSLAQAAGETALESTTDKPVEPQSFEQQLQVLYEYIQQQGVNLALNVVAAIAIFIVGRMIVNWLVGFCIGRLQERFDDTLISFLSSIVRTLLLAVVVMAALERLGVNTTSFAAILAAAGLAVGLALQGSLSNLASGVMIILFRPFKVGDFVEAGGSTGVVEDIQIFCTIMKTGDNCQIVIPNSQITGGSVTNFSAKSTRRIDLVFGCGYGDDLKAVKTFLEELLRHDERVLNDPEPVVAVAELADSSVNFVVRPWVASSDYWAVRFDINEAVKLGFDERGFNIPYPTRDLNVTNSNA
jgi:small conductance mechanosensitive channel